jgi:hypothetical protein
MTADQIEACDKLWREALEAGLVQYQRGMVTRSGRIIASVDPPCVYTGAGVARVSLADVRLDWSHPATISLVAALACGQDDFWLPDYDADLDRHGRGYHMRPRFGWASASASAPTKAEAILRAILATRGER